MTALLEVAGLSKRYRTSAGPTDALRDVSFTLARGETLGVIGQSGSGKSTLASVVVRLDDPDAGTIRFDGVDIGALPARRCARAPWRRRIQFVFQDARDSIDPLGRAFDAIAGALAHGVGGEARRERVEALARAVDLPLSRLALRPHQLSGGEAARVCIARAIASGPDLLVLDEPTAALDVSVQAGVLATLDRLRRERGMAMLFISHDLDVVRLFCSRALVMNAGEIVETGPTAAVFAQPQHAYTRALLDARRRATGSVSSAALFPLSSSL
ncbi:ABC transporter family protein [Paraburkholderia unamae]|uniref:ABC transporter ATP-binding protein n=1 Tax=Paraburkholderia unamae TaxID=219649 RepID=UPI001CAEB872|nr:ABC transporter ATP-binding protein [Paraburkholderia unamae]CAG9271306.1 ABC transporter family protein [Paraburkholderia unamae]